MHVPHLSWQPDLDELNIEASGLAEEGFKGLFLAFRAGLCTAARELPSVAKQMMTFRQIKF